MRKIVYIASVGYSGSTLLDMILGTNNAITSIGEVSLISKYFKYNFTCTCGKKIKKCEFWKNVEKRLKVRKNNINLDLAEYHTSVNMAHKTTHRWVPSISEILLIVGNKKLWEIASIFNNKVKKYINASLNTILLYKAVSDITGTEIIVDSSKYPVQLKSLYLAIPDKFKIIYLVRDGRGNSFSLMKHNTISMEKAAKIWVRYNWNLMLIMRSIPKKNIFFLKYEDLCENTETVLKALQEFIGLKETLQYQIIEKNKFHNIGGNPMRFRRNEKAISLDEKWKTMLNDDDLNTFKKIGSDMNEKLGYEI